MNKNEVGAILRRTASFVPNARPLNRRMQILTADLAIFWLAIALFPPWVNTITCRRTRPMIHMNHANHGRTVTHW